MNIVTIKVGQFYDLEYGEFLFKTSQSHNKFFNDEGKITPEFLNWLKEYHYDNIIKQWEEHPEYFEIDFWYEDNMDEVIL